MLQILLVLNGKANFGEITAITKIQHSNNLLKINSIIRFYNDFHRHA